MTIGERWSKYMIEALRIVGPDRTMTYTPAQAAEVSARTADAMLSEYRRRFGPDGESSSSADC